jgi:Fic family protein
MMKWNWQLKDWSNFTYNKKALDSYEQKFQHSSGKLAGTFKHFSPEDKNNLTIDLISQEAVKTSEIEGEILNRDSVQSSIARNLGLKTDNRRVSLAEQGISDMMVDLFKTFNTPLLNTKLFKWHKMLMQGNPDIGIENIGKYRASYQPMRVVSGRYDNPKIIYEAVPSTEVKNEMSKFITWFNKTRNTLPALTRSGITHWYFICIHPFEDGNGRIARVLTEKALSQSLNAPTLIALALTIEKNKKTYYNKLKENNHTNNIQPWLNYFSQTVLTAIEYTQAQFNFVIKKTKFFDRFGKMINKRQEKVLARIFREGIEDFKGGLSAENYISITKTSRATATRDLADLTNKKALYKTGIGKGTRYFIS